MGLKAKLKAAVTGLTNTQQTILLFVAAELPPVIAYLEAVGAGTPVNGASLAILGAALLGGVLAVIVKMLGNSVPAVSAPAS